ncbi:contractile injection system protein, VgrG/Pvc8 family [Novosphingobium sp. SL115]|uniref:contractile injection system protein, VgrG/Pvc8 family n=1 Tax=Novosphingobium sp. SL115 TaxID=2995150 RepID=UPI002276D23D|nr:contractile injection system protein, VgrG/Pvc8 family [Novosphingobium sp. SL115]MCY1672133.1 contractile injection system protein, VgrG/Pvc8 family [Novosphingobium sp. SL115]
MAANIAGMKLLLDDGTDLAAKIDPRFIELTLTEKRGGEADELSLTLQNHDGRLIAPETGRILTLSLGWRSGGTSTGLVGKGRFKVDEVEESGPPDIITIRARSADLAGDYRKRRTQVWRDTTVGALLSAIAARNGIAAKVHPDLAGLAIEVLDQHGKSDMAMVKDLGSRFDAVATWKDRALLFMPVGASTTASGAAIPTLTLTRRDGGTWRFTRADRDEHNGAEAEWHDKAQGKRQKVTSGGTNRKRLKRVYASQAEADQAARAAANKGKRGAIKFEYALAQADMQIQPNARAKMLGWNARVDAAIWLVESVETSLGAGGLQQKVTLESA